MSFDPVGLYLLKVKNRNTRTRREICLKLTIKTGVVLVSLLLAFTPCSNVSIVNVEHVIADWGHHI